MGRLGLWRELGQRVGEGRKLSLGLVDMKPSQGLRDLEAISFVGQESYQYVVAAVVVVACLGWCWLEVGGSPLNLVGIGVEA